MRFTPEMTLRRSGVYFRKTRSILRVLFSSTILKVEMYPSSFSMRAISAFSFDAGTSTRWCLAAAALRMRVRKSAMGSVCIFSPVMRRLPRRLPASFRDAGNFSLERHTAETDSAHLELPDVRASAATNAAAVANAHFEFRFLMRLCDFCQACHLLRSSRNAQGNSETFEKFAAFLVVLCGGGQRDVHAFDLVHARVIDFGKHELVFEAQGVVATAIESMRRQAAEVADARQNHIAEPVEKFVHLFSAQGDGAADGHAFADFEVGNGLFGARDDRLLSGDLAELDRGGIQQLGVLAGFAEADVHRDFLQFRNGHLVFPAKTLHQGRHRFAAVFFV